MTMTEGKRLHRREARLARRRYRKEGRPRRGRPERKPDTRTSMELLERAFRGINPMSEEQRYESTYRGPRHRVRVKMRRQHRQAVGEGRKP